MNPQLPCPQSRGFALVVTLSLMILLTIIAVGLLTLSSISLRASSQESAMAEARANARLVLMLALGDLQKHLGPDRAVTASSEILATSAAAVAKPNTTGVWESWWDFNPNGAPGYGSEKTSRFRRWLVSSADVAAAGSRDFATTVWTGKSIELVGNGSLGAGATTAGKVTAGLVPVSKNGGIHGSYGWHVSDESVKARINHYRDPGQNTTLAQKRALLAGHRPDPSVMKGPDGSLLTCLPNDRNPASYTNAKSSAGKIIDLNQAELLDNAKDKIKPFRNDVTTCSLGVMADVRGGGLKQDLSSMFEMGGASSNTLPAEFTSKKLYQSTHGITGESDPYWSALAGYYNSFLSVTNPETAPTYATKSNSINNITTPAPTGYNPAPVIAKVDTIFSLVCRPFDDFSWLPRDTYDYMVSLIFTPVVTLHNPYNVNISFHRMNVKFLNVPVAFNFMLQKGGAGPFESQSVEPGKFEALNTMIGYPAGRHDKTFEMSIANWSSTQPLATSTAISGPIVMKPGQTLVCGPSFDPDGSFKIDTGLGGDGVGFDWENDLTDSIKAKPSFTPGLGFETVAVNIKNPRTMGGRGVFARCATVPRSAAATSRIGFT
jgi:hypothetical protein